MIMIMIMIIIPYIIVIINVIILKSLGTRYDAGAGGADQGQASGAAGGV